MSYSPILLTRFEPTIIRCAFQRANHYVLVAGNNTVWGIQALWVFCKARPWKFAFDQSDSGQMLL